MYKVLASTRLDMNKGWVWVTDKVYPQRSVIQIKNNKNGQSIYCECLEIDKNFKKEYNQSPRIHIQDNQDTIIINAWYRERLGDIETKKIHDLKIKKVNNWWGKFRANIGHPQIIVRLATWLAIISIGLGLFSVILTII